MILLDGKKVSQDIDNIKFNTAISALMILLNEITKVGKINHAEFKPLHKYKRFQILLERYKGYE